MKPLLVYNAGRPGDTTLELLARYERDVAARLPDLVYLLVGGNDMFYPGHILAPESYRENLTALTAQITAAGAGLALFTLPPFYRPFLIENFPETLDHPLSTGRRLQAANHIVREVAREFRAPLIPLDRLIAPADDTAQSLVMNEANSGRRDGIHLTADGLKIMAEAAFAVHREHFREARTIVCFGDSITYGVYMPGKGTAEVTASTYPGMLHRLLATSCA